MKKEEEIKRTDWLLFAIAAAGEKGISPVRLQKSLFLLSRMLPKVIGRNYYHFIPYNWGPFDVNVYRDVELLIKNGFVHSLPSSAKRWFEYIITDKGAAYLERIKTRAPKKGVEYLTEVVKWSLSVTFQQLLSFIYSEFPEFRKKSVFRY
jgi:uncharacterized protein YwgA